MASSSNDVKRAIAAIGGGTGLTAVWALEDMDTCDVTLFEASERLGGHINSVALVGKKRDGSDMQPVILEGGAEFIGPPDKYVNFHRLCQYLNVAFEKYQLNMEFHNLSNNDRICLPPLAYTSDGQDTPPTGCLSFLSAIFRSGKNQEDISLSVHTLICHLDDMLNLNALINKAEELDRQGPPAKTGKTGGLTPLSKEEKAQRLLKLRHRIAQAEKIQAAITGADVESDPERHPLRAETKHMITLEQFINSWINGKASRRTFANRVMYPLIAAGWGVSVTTIRTFGAHYAMQYLRAGSEWFHATQGLSTYIQALETQCHNARFEMNSPISRVEQIEIDGLKKYRILKKDGRYDLDEQGEIKLYDELIISTPAYVTKDVLAGINDPIIQDLVQKLAAVEYYDTTVAFHQDQEYWSEDHTVVHTRAREVRVRGANGRMSTVVQGANTMCKGFLFKEEGALPIMKTWVLPGDPMPENVLAVRQYRHPVMNQAYKNAQDALHRVQGHTGLWFGGILAGVSDAHESGITVAMEVAAKISDRLGCLSRNERLKSVCPDIVNRVRAGTCELACRLIDEDDDDIAVPVAMSSSSAMSASSMT